MNVKEFLSSGRKIFYTFTLILTSLYFENVLEIAGMFQALGVFVLRNSSYEKQNLF